MLQEPQRSSSTVAVNEPVTAAKDTVVNENPNLQTGFSTAVIDSTPPDGGKDAWLVVLGSFLAMFSSFGIVNAYVRTTYLRPTIATEAYHRVYFKITIRLIYCRSPLRRQYPSLVPYNFSSCMVSAQ